MDAIKLKSSKSDIQHFVAYSISCIALGLGFAVLGPLLPSLAAHMEVNLGQISFLFTANSFGYLLGSSVGGKLYDKVKGHILMSLALGLMFLMCLVIPIVPNFTMLLLMIFLFGIGQGLLDVGANTNLLWVFQSRVGPYMNGLHFFFGIGALLSPIIVHNVMRLANGSLTWPFWTLAILYLPSLIGLVLLKSPDNPERDHNLNQRTSSNGWLVVLMMLLFFLYVGVEGGYGGIIYTYVTEVKVASETGAAYVNSIYWGALTLGRLITIVVAKKIAPAKILLGNFLLSLLSICLILLNPVDPITVWVGTIGLGLGFSSVFPTLLVLAETRLKITGGITGLFFLGSSLGGMIIPMLLGQIFEYVGTAQVMTTIFAFLILGLIVLISVILASNKSGEKIRIEEISG
jgi:FHS family Na+ dependent glucose MFS transporter 1